MLHDCSRYDRPDLGLLGLLNSDPEPHPVITLAPKGRAVGKAMFLATGYVDAPKEVGKRLDVGKPVPLPPGKYQLGLDAFPFAFVQPKATTLKGAIEVR